MKAPSPIQLAWLVPITLFIHQVEEYANHFPAWYSKWLGASLSDGDFLAINLPALLLVILFAATYRHSRNNLLLMALGTLLFLNGTAHLLISIFSLAYTPGTASGVLLFLPLGAYIFQEIAPQLSEKGRIQAIVLGIVILLAIGSIARFI